jgi:hypothetical protein
MLKRKIEKTYNEGLENYGKKGAIALCVCVILGLIIGYFGAFAIMGAIVMGLWNLFAPMLGCTFVFTFWHGVGVVVAWKLLRAILRGLFVK